MPGKSKQSQPPEPTITEDAPGPMDNRIVAMQDLFDFDSPTDVLYWDILGTVAGSHKTKGRSMGRTEDIKLIFSGTLPNPDGQRHAAIRSDGKRFDLDGFDGLMMRLRGDGRPYRFVVGPAGSSQFRSLRYEAAFPTTAGKWQRVYVPFVALVAVTFGQPAPDAAPVDRRRIGSLGYIVDGDEGPFTLTVDWIKAYREG